MMVDQSTSMDTQQLRIDPAAVASPAAQDAIQSAAAVIRRGGLVAFPTETVYGLGANALDADAVFRIFVAKGRPAYDPIIVHVTGAGDLSRLVREIPPRAELLMDAFWPGPLTLVLPKAPSVPPVVTAGGPTVAVRAPAHAVAQALLAAAQRPIAAPSANRFSHTSPTRAEHVLADLTGRIDLVLDGGPTPIGVESTVLDVTGPTPVLLRPGGVSLEALEAVAGPVTVADRDRQAAHLPSPGMLERHYAPRTPLWLVTGGDSQTIRRALAELAAAQEAAGHRVGLLVVEQDVRQLDGPGRAVISLGSIDDLDTVARHLFNAMRTLDAAGVDLILARDVPATGLGLAVRDRLRRAADRVLTE